MVYECKCHADLDGDVHDFVNLVLEKHQYDVGLDTYQVEKRDGQAFATVQFSQYLGE